MKKYLIILVSVLLLSANAAFAATDDFTANTDVTIQDVVGDGVTANVLILSGSKAQSIEFSGGSFTITNPNSGFKLTISSSNVLSIRANKNGGEIACTANENPGTTQFNVPESAGTYTIMPSKYGCSGGSGTGSSGSGGGGGGSSPKPKPVTPPVTLPEQASERSKTVIAALQLTRPMRVGQVGEDVRSLQKFLNSTGFAIGSSGPGSPGQETTYFGNGTRAAVIKFQIAQGIIASANDVGAGNVGPKTRAKIHELSLGAPEVGPTTPSAMTPATITPSLFTPAQLQILQQLIQKAQLNKATY